MTIFFGANDAAIKEYAADVHIPLPEYKTNLEKIVDRAKQSYPSAKILIIAPPPVNAEQRLEYQKRRYGDKATGILERTSQVTGTYAEVCRKIAATKNIPCMDLFTAMRTAEENVDEDDIGRFFCDGLHFSKTGHKFVSKTLMDSIRTYFPSLEVHSCPKTGRFNNSSTSCDDVKNSGPYLDVIKSKRKWEDAFE